jgi:hypothetical protein
MGTVQSRQYITLEVAHSAAVEFSRTLPACKIWNTTVRDYMTFKQAHRTHHAFPPWILVNRILRTIYHQPVQASVSNYRLDDPTMVERVDNPHEKQDLPPTHGQFDSLSTSIRKNEDRIISSVTRMKRKIMGRRGDLLLQKGMAEYGCAEAGAKYEGPQGSKRMMESGLKAPKMLKDMLNNLATMVEQEEDRVVKLRTVGYIHSGRIVSLEPVEGTTHRY